MTTIKTTRREETINPLDPDAKPDVKYKTTEEVVPTPPAGSPAIVQKSETENSVM